jgi:hypothetical protein
MRRNDLMTLRSYMFVGPVLFALSAAPAPHSVPIPTFNWERVLGASDLVVSLEADDAPTRPRVTFVFFGEGVNRGERVTLSAEAVRQTGLRTGKHVTAFLKYEDEARKVATLAAPFHAWYHAEPLPEDSKLAGRAAMEAQVVRGLLSADPLVIRDAVVWGEKLKSEAARRTIRRLAQREDRSPIIYAAHLAQEIPRGDPGVLEAALTFLRDVPDGVDPISIGDVRLAFFSIHDPPDRAFLNRLLLSAPPDIAQAIISSAAQSKWADASTVPYLLAALDRLDVQGQYRALIVLARLTHRPRPRLDGFREHRSQIVAEWKTWWNDEGEGIYGHPE